MSGAGLQAVTVRAIPPEEGAKGPALVLAAGASAAHVTKQELSTGRKR
jgi:hypothetical protein